MAEDICLQEQKSAESTAKEFQEFQKRYDSDQAALKDEMAVLMPAINSLKVSKDSTTELICSGEHQSLNSGVRFSRSTASYDPLINTTKMGKFDIPKYNGTDHFREWMYKCKQFFESHNIAEDNKIKIAAVHLSGESII
ncbi:hypothetical protein SLE2022_053270 [Rubroshorea leprosula]